MVILQNQICQYNNSLYLIIFKEDVPIIMKYSINDIVFMHANLMINVKTIMIQEQVIEYVYYMCQFFWKQ